ncbi:Hsp20/alpha crystallin family protein [Paenibacillus sp. MZ04-78.2]|uniref:Hsp20/alpha crystallin family protein n=1 Tax=Paenibacillus sp. MZ04-78.2 TaxID=2962034 RepID=UPI0020B7B2B0|nr:Hsp20/alpha crystallin family protein [Paenibacillus sp. MZ04-78.2]MCP3771883.1 Hsp20/alpha crystallin family protein [Paenibacillus sp. MZ04-78.2]
MSDSKNNNSFFDMNWKHFEQLFNGKLPYPAPPLSGQNGDTVSWVEGYIKDVLNQALPNVEVQALKHHFHFEIFDTHNNIIVKIHIPDKEQARKIRLKLNPYQIRLEELPDDKIQAIRLSTQVVPSSCKAVYKNGILQIHIRKQPIDHPFLNVDIRFP